MTIPPIAEPLTRVQRLVAVARAVCHRLRLQAELPPQRYPASDERIFTRDNPSPWRTYQPRPLYLRLVHRREP